MVGMVDRGLGTCPEGVLRHLENSSPRTGVVRMFRLVFGVGVETPFIGGIPK